MAQPKPWLKMWREWIHDPKMLGLTLAEQGAWWRLVTLAQECAAEGAIVKSGSQPLSIQEIATCLHITKQRDIGTLESMVQKMKAQGSINFNGRILTITHFSERQELTPSASREAVRERVRRHRESQRRLPIEALGEEIRSLLLTLPEPSHEEIKETLIKLGQTKRLVPRPEVITDIGRIDLLWQEPTGEKIAAFEIDMYEPKAKSLRKLRKLCPNTFIILRTNPEPFQWDQNILLIGLAQTSGQKSEAPQSPLPSQEEEGEGEGEGEGNDKKLVTSEPALAKISKLHEQYFGIITPVLAEKFKDFVENYRGPVEWIKEAFAEAVKYRNRRWQYVEAILYSWQEKGGPHADRREPSDERGRLGADRPDPLASYREQGWEVLGEEEPGGAEAGNQAR